jgi:hypothetical protein
MRATNKDAPAKGIEPQMISAMKGGKEFRTGVLLSAITSQYEMFEVDALTLWLNYLTDCPVGTI